MKRKQQIQQRRAELVSEMKKILVSAEAENRDLDDTERGLYDMAKAEHEQLTDQLARLEDIERMEADLATVEPAAARGHRPGPAPGPETPREFESFGQFVHAVRFRPSDPRLEWQDNPIQGEQRMDSGAAGGFAVPKQFVAQLREVTPQESIVRPRAEIIPAGSPPDAEITMPALDQTGDTANMFGGVQVYWIGEGDPKPETDFKLREISWKPHEVAGHIKLTDKLLRNWPAASAMIERQLRAAALASEDRQFLRGSGVGAPLGIIHSEAAYKVNRATGNEIHIPDVFAMMARILRGGSLAWIASPQIIPQLQAFKDDSGGSGAEGGGQYIWQESAREGEPARLFGHPILWNQRSPALGSKGDLVLADLNYYVIKDGSGPFVQASEHVEFLTNKTVIKITWNVDGAPWLTAPIKQEESGYEVSPFVVLDVPSGG